MTHGILFLATVASFAKNGEIKVTKDKVIK